MILTADNLMEERQKALDTIVTGTAAEGELETLTAKIKELRGKLDAQIETARLLRASEHELLRKAQRGAHQRERLRQALIVPWIRDAIASLSREQRELLARVAELDRFSAAKQNELAAAAVTRGEAKAFRTKLAAMAAERSDCERRSAEIGREINRLMERNLTEVDPQP